MKKQLWWDLIWQIHKKSCAKLTNKPRKVFDSTKQRAAGTEISYKQMKTAQKKVVAPPKSNWRAQHEDFVNTVRAARGVTEAMKSGKPLPPPPPASINPDYIQCPYCERRFNSKAAERHIGFCKEQHARKGNKPNAIAKKPPSSRMQPPKAGMAKPSPTGPPGGNRAPASRIPGTTPARTPGSTGTPGRTPGTTGTPGRTPTTSAGRGKTSRFCHDCGTKYPVVTAKFCCECGIRRIALT
ncbi:hypothetical protein LOTGIDRAFT_167531 [Lottia gigantea]|uniref:C2HC/C3H-type domain-containing protein n=1 Tax=Lottia gigantea TaxID=225164 RepID=V3ZYG5_LOTGI|nr:hypothetical protein LOTGIDRAFT_167531 [Lottia gigantea]ESO86026.1 hypothetical protein LOTGIDRAFT_167531 [Lottia gigantea]